MPQEGRGNRFHHFLKKGDGLSQSSANPSSFKVPEAHAAIEKENNIQENISSK